MSKKQEKPPKFQWFRGSSSAWLIPSPISPLLFLQGVPKDIFHPPSCALRQCWAQPRIPQASDVEFICFKFKEVKFWFFFPSCSQPSSWTMNIPRSSKNLSVPLDSLQGSAPALSMLQDNQRAFPCSSPFGWDREFNQFMIDLKKKTNKWSMLVIPKAPKEADFGISARKNKSLLMDFPAPRTWNDKCGLTGRIHQQQNQPGRGSFPSRNSQTCSWEILKKPSRKWNAYLSWTCTVKSHLVPEISLEMRENEWNHPAFDKIPQYCHKGSSRVCWKFNLQKQKV